MVLDKLHAVNDSQQADASGAQGPDSKSPSADAPAAVEQLKSPTPSTEGLAAVAPAETDGAQPTQAISCAEGIKHEGGKGIANAPDAPSAENILTPAEQALREIKAAYVTAKRRYRTSAERIAQLQSALDLYVGTHNFHNYTILKKFTDSSAKRHIKSFKVNTTPIQIRDTEWLSLKVHGQSFMMHQIRKMVAMAVLLVRCGAPLDRIKESYGDRRISVPKAPGLGLLLERPVFDNYNHKATEQFSKEPIDFGKYEKEILEFKNEQIYKRMWDVEENDNAFHTFFHQLDNFNTDFFLWVTAHGFDAAYERKEKGERVPKALEEELGDEGEDDPDQGEG